MNSETLGIIVLILFVLALSACAPTDPKLMPKGGPTHQPLGYWTLCNLSEPEYWLCQKN